MNTTVNTVKFRERIASPAPRSFSRPAAKFFRFSPQKPIEIPEASRYNHAILAAGQAGGGRRIRGKTVNDIAGCLFIFRAEGAAESNTGKAVKRL